MLSTGRARAFVALLTAIVALGTHAAAPNDAAAAGCPATGARTLWVDYADRFVPFRNTVFRRRGITGAVSRPGDGRQLRSGGADTAFWDMNLNKRVGTPREPADPATIPEQADRLYDYAVSVTACARPVIGLNELFGSQLATPWSATNRQYRANVLTLLRGLAARGAQPVLFVSHPPASDGGAVRWWREVANVSDIAREIYPVATQIAAKGPVGGSKAMRALIRRGARDFMRMGIPAHRVGIVLGFHSTPGVGGGRNGLEPTSAWLNVVKLETLAATRVASELRIGTVWSWGWGVFGGQADPDKPRAACVYLWARDPALCNGPAVAGPGFNASRTQGQLERAAIELDIVAVNGSIVSVAVAAIAVAKPRTVLIQRRSPNRRWVTLRRLVLSPVEPAQLIFRLPRGWSSLRVVGEKKDADSLRSRVRNIYVGVRGDP